MKNALIFFAVLLVAFSATAQDKLVKHTVVKGETITQIAQKYRVTPADIYRLNPDSQNGVKPGMVLLIQGNPGKKEKTEVKAEPKPEVKTTSIAVVKNHTVAAKETLYSLAKTYDISIAELEKANPEIVTGGLKVGGTIKIPTKNQGPMLVNAAAKAEKKDKGKKDKEILYHQVEAKETKYSIAKKYGITVADLEASKPEVKDGLQIGYRLKIIGGKVETQQVSVKEDESIVIRPMVQKPEFSEYEVKPKETIYGLTRKTGLSQEALFKLNPELKDGLKDGMKLKLPASITVVDNPEKELASLSKTLKTQDRKQLVLLLPFNISKIQGDTVNSMASRLKTDKFLNMTLDFYSGALMAIDSARTLNLNVDIKILDSQETKGASAVTSLIQQQNLDKADVVIGPFYQTNAEKTADLLGKSNVPVISPLSKEAVKLYPNLLQSMPSPELIKNAMLDFMRSKEGNILAVIDAKRLSSKQFFSQNNKDVKIIGLTEKNQVTGDSISKKLVKGRRNYVILDSEKTGMILSTLNLLIILSKDYEIQLVVLEKNDTLDFEEIPLAKLAQLKLLYPSLTRDNQTPEAAIFEREYKEKNKIFPNQYATRGFDVTFDALLRLSQEKTFMEIIDTVATEQVENKFEYEKQAGGGYLNKGFYILFCDADLSVKPAN